MKTIVLTGGGTAGHCLPHFAVLPYISYDKIYYIGSKNGIEKDIISKTSIPYYPIDTVKLQRKLTLKNFLIPIKLLSSIKQAEKILKELKPSLVFSKGGFVGLPVVISAYKLKIPVVVHESDLSIGLANKISSRYAKKVLFSFDKDFNLPNQIITGPPINENLYKISKSEGLKYYGLPNDKPILLVTGGSLGAKTINEGIRNNLNLLTKKFTILHIVGKNNVIPSSVKGYYQVEFTKMEYAYAVCDICVSRAGSNTAFELLSKKIPTLFIPLSKGASRGDQIENAKYFESKKLCKVLQQENMDNLITSIFSLYNNKDYYINNLTKNPIKNGNKKIADVLNSIICNQFNC